VVVIAANSACLRLEVIIALQPHRLVTGLLTALALWSGLLGSVVDIEGTTHHDCTGVLKMTTAISWR
jgi:hypothetical protein